MSESTAPEIMAAVPNAAPVKTSSEGIGSIGPTLEIASPDFSSGIIFQAAPLEGSVSIGPLPKVGAAIDLLGGTTEPKSFGTTQPNPATHEFIPDEFSDSLRNTDLSPLNPFEISQAVESFFNPVDEPLPEPGILPTPREAVDAIDRLLGNTDKNLKDTILKTDSLSRVSHKIHDLMESPFTKQVEAVQPIIQAEPAITTIQSIEISDDEQTIQNPAVNKAVQTLSADVLHAEATVKALLDVGITNAVEIVSTALTMNLAKEKISAVVTVQAQSKPFLSFDPHESFVFKLELRDEGKKVPQQLYVIDTDAQEAQRVAFDIAIENAVEENKKQGMSKVSGKDVLKKFLKKEGQKSQPLENTMVDDGALAETTIEARGFLPTIASTLKKYFQNLITAKPPIRQDTHGNPVPNKDIARMFNGKKVIDNNSAFNQ